MKFGPVAIGLLAAALFGLSTPLSKILLGSLSQFQLAGLLYLGAGIGMLPFVIRRRRSLPRSRIDRKNALRLGASVLLGGGMGPVFLLMGLSRAHASSVSLWLNLELAATAVMGVLFFKDQLDLYGWFGAGGAVLAGVLVALGEGAAGIVPSLLVALACICWALDNNLTALIDGLTPQEITLVKGLVAGAANNAIGAFTIGSFPSLELTSWSLALGAGCYGGSIALYISAAQKLGAARSQVLFSSAPLLGALFSVLILSERPSWTLLVAAAILVGSIVLMRLGRHAHAHFHGEVTHIHAHRHDDGHHAHSHEGLPKGASHTHLHTHSATEHDHPHVPDLHHRHEH